MYNKYFKPLTSKELVAADRWITMMCLDIIAIERNGEEEMAWDENIEGQVCPDPRILPSYEVN